MMYIFLKCNDVLQCKSLYKILLYYLVLYFTISFVHIKIIVLLHVCKEGPLQISTMY